MTCGPAQSRYDKAKRGLAFGLAEAFEWEAALTAEDTAKEFIDENAFETADDWFRKARPAAHARPGLLGKDAALGLLKPTRGRPFSANPTEHVNVRLDPDVLDAFQRTGSGWQTRLSAALHD